MSLLILIVFIYSSWIEALMEVGGGMDLQIANSPVTMECFAIYFPILSILLLVRIFYVGMFSTSSCALIFGSRCLRVWDVFHPFSCYVWYVFIRSAAMFGMFSSVKLPCLVCFHPLSCHVWYVFIRYAAMFGMFSSVKLPCLVCFHPLSCHVWYVFIR